jgi:hypothetical protein
MPYLIISDEWLSVETTLWEALINSNSVNCRDIY